MSLTAAAIRLMASKGMSAEDIADIAEAMQAPMPALSPGALRTRKWREKNAEASPGDVTETDNGDVSHVRTGAQVVTPSLPSLRSEELKPPVSPNGLTAPKGSEKQRGTYLPESWSPDEAGWSYAAETLGPNVDPARELDRFRDYWRAIPGGKGRKADWPATWRNWCRNAADRLPKSRGPHDRPDRHHPAAPGRAARRGVWAEVLAEERGATTGFGD